MTADDIHVRGHSQVKQHCLLPHLRGSVFAVANDIASTARIAFVKDLRALVGATSNQYRFADLMHANVNFDAETEDAASETGFR